jgi:ABC-type branched-subunit amino acid transport system ATPase component
MKFLTIEVLRNLGWDLIEPKVELEKNITYQNIELNRNHRHLLFIARAVLCNGQVMLLNKPFHGLNETIAKKCFNYLESLTPNKTIIIISETQTLPFFRPELNENLERQVG